MQHNVYKHIIHTHTVHTHTRARIKYIINLNIVNLNADVNALRMHKWPLHLIIDASMAQPHTIPVVSATMMSSKAMPLLESTNSELATESFEMPAPKVVSHITHVDKLPLPFEEIPGPAILKLWEKYWRYVPLFGTQLFCSLLISRLGSQGTIP